MSIITMFLTKMGCISLEFNLNSIPCFSGMENCYCLEEDEHGYKTLKRYEVSLGNLI